MAHLPPNMNRHRVRRVRHAHDGYQNEGMTGMGPNTRRHFGSVQRKIMDYLGYQEEPQYYDYYDGAQLPRHGTNLNPNLDDENPAVDGKRANFTKKHPSPTENSHPHSPRLEKHSSKDRQATNSRQAEPGFARSLHRDIHVKHPSSANASWRTRTGFPAA